MKKLLQTLGLRTKCCNAKIITWHHDKHYCSACKQWLDKPAVAVETVAVKSRIAH